MDDGADPVDDLLPPDSRIRYVRAVAGARSGRSATWRAPRQAANSSFTGTTTTGRHRGACATRRRACWRRGRTSAAFARLWFYDPASGSAWRYMYPQGQRPWVAGNTLCYRKAFWRINPFPDLTVGEDTRFQWTARPKHIQMLPDERFFVALIHPHNTSPKRTHDGRWQAQNVGAVQALLGEDWAFYAGLAGSTARLPPGASDC